MRNYKGLTHAQDLTVTVWPIKRLRNQQRSFTAIRGHQALKARKVVFKRRYRKSRHLG
jgi:hypothetical protein